MDLLEVDSQEALQRQVARPEAEKEELKSSIREEVEEVWTTC